MFIPDLDLDFDPSRIQGSKRHRILDPDPQHCLEVQDPMLIDANCCEK
jgi:hypothetical protein